MAGIGEHTLVSKATVISISNASDTVKTLSLKVAEKNVSFKAGQWVDLIIPGVEEVGGFSICSSPMKLQMCGIVDLAVQASDASPSMWVHSNCHLGSEVEMRVGGDFVYDPRIGDPTTDLLLVAGGIGVNPLYSMIQHAADLLQEGATGIAVAKPRAVTLLFSAKTRQELIHRRTLQMLSEEFPTINVRLFVTQEPEAGDANIAVGRIGEAQLRDALDGLEKSATWCYVCGPTPMIDEVETALQKLGVAKDRIRAEKWC